ncbi:MAG: hypothetical protein N2Z74_03895 [Syntrophales bacterium]|nr:hypothetical protein [Syntrophales bacterium]
MEIKMPVKFHGNYVVSIRSGDKEDRERCQKLTIRRLSPEEQERFFKGLPPEDIPTHQVTFYDFGCKRIIEGILKDNGEERVSFLVKDKEYAFSPFVPK